MRISDWSSDVCSSDLIGELAEGRRIALDLVAETALEPLGGELDRRQRILDLVRDAPGDVGPGRAPLVEQLLSDILETQDVAVALRHRLGRERRGLGILPRQLHDPRSEEHKSELQSLMRI